MPSNPSACRRFAATLCCLLLLVSSAVIAADSADRRGEPTRHLVQVHAAGPADYRALAERHFDIAGSDHVAGTIQLIATDEELAILDSLALSYEVLETRVEPKPLQRGRALSDYLDPAEVEAAIDELVAAHPTLIEKILLEDTLFEGFKLWAVKITKDVAQPNNRPNFMFDSQHHAREVMTPEIAVDMIQYLTNRYATDAEVRRWVDEINIWVVPVVNPEGTNHVFNHDSWWRKNRHPGCPVDLNRNYEFDWNGCNGSSGSCSSDTFRGTEPESEPETQAMVELMSQTRPLFALSYHSHGTYILYSYGCGNSDEHSASTAVAQALNAVLEDDNGNTGQYRTGPIHSTIYNADGGSCDTQYGKFGTHSYVIEVNSSSTGGFHPDYATWRDVTVERQRVAWKFFLDRTLDGSQIRGRITDERTGAPLAAGVSVDEVTFTNGEWARHADSRGLYHWLLENGQNATLRFSAPGYCTETLSVTGTNGAQIQDITLSYPDAPSGLVASPDGDHRIALSWDAVSGASEYIVLRALASGGPYTEVTRVVGTQSSWTDTDVSGAVPYYYVVRTFDDCASRDSNEASATTGGACTLPPAFGGLASVSNPMESGCRLSLDWSAADDYCGGQITYRVYRGEAPDFVPAPANLIAAGLGTTSYTDHGALASGVRYHYVVRAVDAVSGAEDANLVRHAAAPTGPLVPGTWRDDAGDTGDAALELGGPWHVAASGGKTGPRVYATGPYANDVCASLTTPPMHIDSGAVLRFASKYDIENNYDVGIVEIATAPGFDNWQKVDTVNYPNGLSNGGNECGIPTSGAGTVFSETHATPSYPATDYSGSLAAWAGQEVRIRFRFGSDGGVTDQGWWIDDIAVEGSQIPGSCSPEDVPLPAEACTVAPLEVALDGSALRLDYGPACGALDHAAYLGGSLTGGLDWSEAYCSLGNIGRATISPDGPAPGELLYFVLVGQNHDVEGSYGRDGAGSERPESSGVGSCDLPQQLGGACP